MYNWKVGDLAVCVENGALINEFGDIVSAPELIIGRVYRVTQIPFENARMALVVDGSGFDEALFFGYIPCRFRPLNDEPDNAELVAKIKNCKPQKVS